jgi:hypothetical protein
VPVRARLYQLQALSAVGLQRAFRRLCIWLVAHTQLACCGLPRAARSVDAAWPPIVYTRLCVALNATRPLEGMCAGAMVQWVCGRSPPCTCSAPGSNETTLVPYHQYKFLDHNLCARLCCTRLRAFYAVSSVCTQRARATGSKSGHARSHVGSTARGDRGACLARACIAWRCLQTGACLHSMNGCNRMNDGCDVYD